MQHSTRSQHRALADTVRFTLVGEAPAVCVVRSGMWAHGSLSPVLDVQRHVGDGSYTKETFAFNHASVHLTSRLRAGLTGRLWSLRQAAWSVKPHPTRSIATTGMPARLSLSRGQVRRHLHVCSMARPCIGGCRFPISHLQADISRLAVIKG
jgi:hypothetical protein